MCRLGVLRPKRLGCRLLYDLGYSRGGVLLSPPLPLLASLPTEPVPKMLGVQTLRPGHTAQFQLLQHHLHVALAPDLGVVLQELPEVLGAGGFGQAPQQLYEVRFHSTALRFCSRRPS